MDTIDNQPGVIEIEAKRDVGVAYTLNNYQPVKCSYIGADPFFFMDADITEEEDELDLMMEMEDLDEELDRLNQKLVAYERFSDEEGQTTEGRLAAFEEDLLDITQNGFKNRYAPTIDSLVSLMEKSRFAGQLMEFASAHGITFDYSEQVMTASYDRDANDGQGKIFLNPHRKLPDTVLAFAGELRRVWQHKKGAGIHPLSFDPDQAILINRLQTADIAVAMIRTGWELQLAEYKSAWTRLEQSSLNDVARSFAREAYLDFRTINNGEAACAAFETWFLSERCRAHDRELIQLMLADTYASVFQGHVARTAVSDVIGRLGEMPFGKNYLAQYAGLIMGDPVFTDVRDRSNANFLWFIKFEQSFTKTEQELQNLSSTPGASASGHSETLKRENYEKANRQEDWPSQFDGENIVRFPQKDKAEPQDGDVAASENQEGDIVLFPKIS